MITMGQLLLCGLTAQTICTAMSLSSFKSTLKTN